MDETSTPDKNPCDEQGQHHDCTDASTTSPSSSTSSKGEQPSGSSRSNNNSNSIMSRMALNDNKAGMEGLDKEKINQIIYEASKGSKFYENERKKEEQLNMRIKEQHAQMDKLSPGKLQEGMREADRVLETLNQRYDLSHTIVHVDMDAFYAAVEMRDNPSLRNKPMAVGGIGMLSTSNYVARRFGVRAAMPGFIGLKLCPDLVIVKANYAMYTIVSHQVREIFAAYDPNFCPMSLDEAYLDFTSHLDWRITSSALERTFLLRDSTGSESGLVDDSVCKCDLNTVLRPLLVKAEQLHERLLSDTVVSSVVEDLRQNSENFKVCSECHKEFPSYKAKVYGVSTNDAVLEMRNRIEQRTQLTASAGIAPNTMLAKVCSDRNKPNGQFRIYPNREEVTNFVETLPIRKISGVGKVTEKLLGALGVSQCSDLHKQRGLLYHLFSPTSFHYFMRISLGLGDTTVERDGERKSMSTERTFNELSAPEDLYNKCRELSAALAEDLQGDHVVGKTVTLKIKTVSFEVKTRSHTLQYDTNSENKIFQAAKQLLKTEIDAEAPNPLRLRLMGVRMSKLSSDSGRQTLTSMFQRQMEKSLAGSAFEKGERESAEEKHCVPENKMDGSEGVPNVAELDSDTVETYRDDDCTMVSSDFQTRSTEQCEHSDNAASSSHAGSKDVPNVKKHGTQQVSKGKGKKRESILKFVCKGDEKVKAEMLNRNISAKAEHSVSEVVVLDDEGEVWRNNDQVIDVTESLESGEDVGGEGDLISCPLCGQQKRNWALDVFNDHVDLCLNKQTIKNILQDQQSEKPSSSSLEKDLISQRKRHKQDVQLTGPSKVVKRCKGQSSLLSFFK